MKICGILKSSALLSSGSWANALVAGAFFVDAYSAASYVYSSVGGRVCYKGEGS